MPAAEEEHVPDALFPFASSLSRHRFGDDDLRLLGAALSAGADVPAMLATRSSARRLLRARAAEAFLQPSGGVEDHGMGLFIADFFARAFALVGDVESCLAMRYEALVLRDAKYSNNLQLQVSRQEWLTFAKDSLDNGFYTIASKAFANALAHIHHGHPAGHLDSINSIAEKDNINDITGLQNLAKSLAAQHSVHTQSAEYMKRRASGVHARKPSGRSILDKLTRLKEERTELKTFLAAIKWFLPIKKNLYLTWRVGFLFPREWASAEPWTRPASAASSSLNKASIRHASVPTKPTLPCSAPFSSSVPAG